MCHDKNQAQSRLNTPYETIDLMLNEMSPFHHGCIGTAQACKTYWEGTERAEVQGARSTPVANLRQILFVFSAGPHEELMKLSGMVLSSGRGRIRAWHKLHLCLPPCKAAAIYESPPLAPATGPNYCTHLWSLWWEGECVSVCVCAHGRKKEREVGQNN